MDTREGLFSFCRNGVRKGLESLPVWLAIVLVLHAVPVAAQDWVSVGPPGGNVRALSADPRNPQRIFLGTGDGSIYRSDDGGRQWHRLTPGFPRRGCSLDEIVVDTRGNVFVGYWNVHEGGGGVARSGDGGQSFVILKGIEGESVRALALAPSNPRVIAAGTLTGVFLSRDGGESWARITPKDHPDLRNVESLAFDPADARILYAGTWHLAWKTTNAGAAWIPIHRGMIDDSDVMRLTVDPKDRRVIYATACTGIYRSADGGAQWTKLRGIPYSDRRTRAFALGPNGLLLAGTTEGLWISSDDAGTWRRGTAPGLVVNTVVRQRDGTILIGAEDVGVLRSSDGGQSWITSNTGFSERFVMEMLFDTAGQRVIVAAFGNPRYSGVFVAPSVGGPWVRLGEGLNGRQVLALALLDRTILAGTDDGIFAHALDADAWKRLDTRVGAQDVHPRVTDLLALPSGRILAATTNGALWSVDAGQTWARASEEIEGEVLALTAFPDDPDLLAMATRSAFFLSRDGGETWSPVSRALRFTPHALMFLPSNRRVLFTTTTGGLYRSADQGVTWRRVNGGVPHADLTGIAVHPDGRTLYVSDFTAGGIFRSVDGGSTWRRMPTEGLVSDRIWALRIDPVSPERLIAGSVGGLYLMIPTPVTSRERVRDSG